MDQHDGLLIGDGLRGVCWAAYLASVFVVAKKSPTHR